MKKFDLAFIGAGIATAFALDKMNEKQCKENAVIFDIGKPPAKRKHQVLGWLGCMLGTDGKLFVENKGLDDILTKKVHARYRNNIVSFMKSKELIGELVDNKLPKTFTNTIAANDYDFESFSYYQMIPKEIHKLSRIISENVIDNKRFTFKFEEEVFDITRVEGGFELQTQYDTYFAKKIVFATGRANWKWTHKKLSEFGLIKSETSFKCGIKVEVKEDCLGQLNKSVFSMKKGNVSIGPFMWNGTMVPEDQLDFVLANFRSNEGRWQSDKVIFDVLGEFENTSASLELSRIASLTSILANERVIKENMRTLMSGKSKLSILDGKKVKHKGITYDVFDYGVSKRGGWLTDAITDLSKVFPNIVPNSKIYIPCVLPYGTYKLDIGKNMELSEDVFVIGESTGVSGIMQAAITGNYFADKNF